MKYKLTVFQKRLNKELLLNGMITLIKGFKNDKGKVFDVYICFDGYSI